MAQAGGGDAGTHHRDGFLARDPRLPRGRNGRRGAAQDAAHDLSRPRAPERAPVAEAALGRSDRADLAQGRAVAEGERVARRVEGSAETRRKTRRRRSALDRLVTEHMRCGELDAASRTTD